jgi:hypothetical protein
MQIDVMLYILSYVLQYKISEKPMGANTAIDQHTDICLAIEDALHDDPML